MRLATSELTLATVTTITILSAKIGMLLTIKSKLVQKNCEKSLWRTKKHSSNQVVKRLQAKMGKVIVVDARDIERTECWATEW